MASVPSKSFDVPFRSAIADATGIITTSWQWFFRSLWERVYPLGIENSFVLANNQQTPADVTGLVFNYQGVTQVLVDYLIQIVTTGTSATELIESGFFILTYRPTLKCWQINVVQSGLPDSSGVTFAITPAAFTATYDHTTSLWTKSRHGLINGHAVTLAAGTSLPTGFAASTTYYVINSSTNSFKLSATLGGSAVVATTDNGSGTLTVSPTHAADGQVQYTSGNTAGTASISSIYWRARTIGGKNSQFSAMGKR